VCLVVQTLIVAASLAVVKSFFTDPSIYSTDIAVILCDQLFYAELFDLSNVESADL